MPQKPARTDKGRGKKGNQERGPPENKTTTQKESVARGETIDADWETWKQREDRLKKECEMRGETFNQESDWDMDGRHADDIRRAHDMAQIRKEKKRKKREMRLKKQSNGKENIKEQDHQEQRQDSH